MHFLGTEPVTLALIEPHTPRLEAVGFTHACLKLKILYHITWSASALDLPHSLFRTLVVISAGEDQSMNSLIHFYKRPAEQNLEQTHCELIAVWTAGSEQPCQNGVKIWQKSKDKQRREDTGGVKQSLF